MNSIIKNSLQKSTTYQDYRDLVKQLVSEESTSGNEKTENLVEYTKLNDKRMKRWDKTLKVSEDFKTKIAEFKEKVTWLVISESWCGDAAHIMPAINKVAELNDNISFKTVLRDENEDLMNLFLTNGSKSIPKLVMIDDASGDVVSTFGPRPNIATQLVNDYKTEFGALTPEFKQDLQVWYNKDKGESTIEDLTQMLCELEPTVCL